MSDEVEFGCQSLNYFDWNAALASYLKRRSVEGEPFLSINPRFLSDAWLHETRQELTPLEAEVTFVESVRTYYNQRILKEHHNLETYLSGPHPAHPADTIALFGVTVLAAYHMSDGAEDEYCSRAYYPRLNKLLGPESSSELPTGMRRQHLQVLWETVEGWLKLEMGIALAEPPTDYPRYIDYPLSQVLLRKVDIDKLPLFFEWAKYGFGADLDPSQLLFDLRRFGRFTLTGRNALEDQRALNVARQVKRELLSWTGEVSELGLTARRVARLELLVDYVRRKPRVYLQPRKPANFPDFFECEFGTFVGEYEGWYEKTLLSATSPINLMERTRWKNSTGLQITREGAQILPFFQHPEFAGYLSGVGLLVRSRSVVLCVSALEDKVENYLEKVCVQPPNKRAPGEVIPGWTLFENVLVDESAMACSTPEGLEQLRVRGDSQIGFTGGLRLGSANWLVDGPPKIFLSGVRQEVFINGIAVSVDENTGELDCSQLLTVPGRYNVVAGMTSRRLHLTEAAMPELPQVTNLAHSGPRRLFLPRGRWTLLGSRPGQVAIVRLPVLQASSISTHFRPVWAIGGEDVAAPQAILVNPDLPRVYSSEGLRPSGGTAVEMWIQALLQAAKRQATLSALCVVDQPFRHIWDAYQQSARQAARLICMR